MTASLTKLAGRTFILGVGAQKSGTTWLYNTLRQHPAVTMSPIKELHYFDAMYGPDTATNHDRRFFARARKIMARVEAKEGLARRRAAGQLEDVLDRIRMTVNEAAYIEYFDRILKAGCTHCGEITPAYSALPEEGFLAFRRLTERADMQPRVVFLMRDPVDRHLSAIRHRLRSDPSLNLDALYAKGLGTASVKGRAGYLETIRTLNAVFAPGSVCYGFYETLFTPPGVAQIFAFLGLEPSEVDFGTRVNASPQTMMPSRENVAAALERFAPVYEGCRELFGDALPVAWSRPLEERVAQ
ncbi:MAG: sulfotransferase [Pseudomonadota bacterium]